MCYCFFFSSRRRHTRCALVTGVQTCALPICLLQNFDGGAFRIGWDAGNGAAGPVVEKLVARLPGEHHLLYTDVDSRFPNHHPDPTEEKNLEDLKALVAERQLDLGFAFDGDGDRIGAVDGEGRVIWGDQLLSILAEPVLEEVPGATIIADVKASQALFDRVEELGGKPLMWKTGHSLIKSKMKETGAPDRKSTRLNSSH